MDLLERGLAEGTVHETKLTRKLTIDGRTKIYPVYSVRLDNLFYNDQNDRIATWVSQYKSEHGGNLGMADKEAYNKVIEQFIVESDPEAMRKTKTNIDFVGQREPGVALSDGRIVDGNRRFTCLRQLAGRDSRFNWFETVILRKDIKINAKQIKMLELMIQRGEESRVDYNPIDRLVGVYNDVVLNRLLTVEEYAMSTAATEADIKKEVELAKLMARFLEFIGAPSAFHIARKLDLNGPLVELHGILKGEADEERRTDIENAVFANLVAKPEPDMTRFVRSMKKVIKSKNGNDYLEEQLNLAESVCDALQDSLLPSSRSALDGIMVIQNKDKDKDDGLKRKMKDSTERAVGRVNAVETRNRPLLILTKAAEAIGEIDSNIFCKLDGQQKADILEQIDEIDRLLDGLGDVLRVH
jgi:hypothetical protein